jgi:hypothetical protein
VNNCSKAQFFSWCFRKGYAVDRKYGNVYFKEGRPSSVTVGIPDSQRALPYLLEVSFANLPAWNHCHVFKRGNRWSLGGAGVSEQIYGEVIKGLGISRSHTGSISFRSAELSKLAAVIFTQLFHADSTDDDFYVVPDNGRWMLFGSHHDCLTFEFTEEKAKQSFEKILKAEEFEPHE